MSSLPKDENEKVAERLLEYARQIAPDATVIVVVACADRPNDLHVDGINTDCWDIADAITQLAEWIATTAYENKEKSSAKPDSEEGGVN
jgi:hypothetical protein